MLNKSELDKLVKIKLHNISVMREEILVAFIAKYGYEPDEMIINEQPSTGRFWVEKRTEDNKIAQYALDAANKQLDQCMKFIQWCATSCNGATLDWNLFTQRKAKELLEEFGNE